MREADFGHLVTCPNGHPICHLRADLRPWTAVSANLFGNFHHNQTPLLNSDSLNQSCNICGERWSKYEEWSGHNIHLEGIGWIK